MFQRVYLSKQKIVNFFVKRIFEKHLFLYIIADFKRQIWVTKIHFVEEKEFD